MGKTRVRVLRCGIVIEHEAARGGSDRGDKREDDEQGQYHELSEFKWRLALCRRHRFQHGDFFERLHDSDKDIEIESKESADHINPTPVAGELARVTRVDRKS